MRGVSQVWVCGPLVKGCSFSVHPEQKLGIACSKSREVGGEVLHQVELKYLTVFFMSERKLESEIGRSVQPLQLCDWGSGPIW